MSGGGLKKNPLQPKASTEMEQEIAKRRAIRAKTGKDDILAADPMPGYRSYWATDSMENRHGNVEYLQSRGWTCRKTSDGSPVTARGGQGRTLYLMDIPEELYMEDFMSTQRELDEADELRRVPRSANQYAPGGSIKKNEGLISD